MTDTHASWFALIVGVLATWRVTHLLRSEDGPWQFLTRLRGWLAPWLGGVLSCFYCTSVWIAAPAALLLGHTWPERAWLWPALSAGAILLDRWITPPAAMTPWFAETPLPENPHELLRSEPKHPGTPGPDPHAPS